MSDTQVVEVGPKGRIVIPVSIRRALDLAEGSELVAMVDGGSVILMPRREIKRRLRDLFSGVPVSLTEELIGERRAEADRDDAG